MRRECLVLGLVGLALGCNEPADSATVSHPAGGSPAPSLDTVAEPGTGLTVVDLGTFSDLEMTSTLQVGYYPALGDRAPEHVTLNYFALTESLSSVRIELPYQLENSTASFDFAEVPVEEFPVPSYVRFETDSVEEGTRTWHVRAGELEITKDGPSSLDLRFSDVEVAERLRPQGTDGPLEAMGDGFIAGTLEEVCYQAVEITGPVSDGTGVPNLDYRRDEAWQSPFCAQINPAAVR